MAQSLAESYFHIVLSTKNRVPFLKDRTLREEMHAYRRLLKEHNVEYDERYVWN